MLHIALYIIHKILILLLKVQDIMQYRMVYFLSLNVIGFFGSCFFLIHVLWSTAVPQHKKQKNHVMTERLNCQSLPDAQTTGISTHLTSVWEI